MKHQLLLTFNAIGCLIIFLLTYLTLLPVETQCAECELWMTGGISVIYILGGVMFIASHKIMRITVADIIILMWFCFYIGIVWTEKEYPCRMQFIGVLVMFLLYFSLRILFSMISLSSWLLVICFIVCGCYEAIMGLEQMINGTSRHSLYLLTGNFLNPGPYSAYLMTGLAIGIVTIQKVGNMKLLDIVFIDMPRRITIILKKIEIRQVLLVAILLMAMVIPSTWSRASFVSIGLICLFVYRKYYWRYKYFVLGLLTLTGLLLYFVKQGSADGRMMIWQAALVTWTSCPWLGVGVGGFCHAVADGMSCLHECGVDLSAAGVTDNAYNIFLKIIVEQGIVGAVFALSLCGATMISLWKCNQPLFYGIVSLLVFSMFSYPLDLLPYKIIVVMTVAWSETSNGKTLFELCWLRSLLLAVIFAFAGKQALDILGERYEADRIYSNFKGVNNDVFLEDYYELLSQKADDAAFLFDYGKILRESRRYNDSNDILHRGILCSADPMFYVLQGNNYKDLVHYDLAEKAYKKAFAVMPNRLYPLYQLMVLYKETGNIVKSKEVAIEILDIRPKVESEATKEMKSIALKLINSDL